MGASTSHALPARFVGRSPLLQVQYFRSEYLPSSIIGNADRKMLDFIYTPVASQFRSERYGECLRYLDSRATGSAVVPVPHRLPVGQMEKEIWHVGTDPLNRLLETSSVW
jgi:hypothetical protein